MKFCPKCRSFYDDASLAFCLTDGIPLVEINQSNALWAEGTNAIETSHKTALKQARQQKFLKISRILVMMMMVAMVITVVAMNIYVNIPTKKDEIVQNITPLPTPTAMPTFMPTPETTIEQTPSPSVSPTPTQALTQTPTPTPTANETPTPTPTKTPVPNPTTPIPPGPDCIHQLEQQKSILIKKNTSFFRSIIEREKGEIIGEYQRTQRKPATAEPTLGRINIQFDGCYKATVVVPYFWTIFPQSPAAVIEPSIKLPAKEKRFFCQRSDTWKCEPL